MDRSSSCVFCILNSRQDIHVMFVLCQDGLDGEILWCRCFRFGAALVSQRVLVSSSFWYIYPARVLFCSSGAVTSAALSRVITTLRDSDTR